MTQRMLLRGVLLLSLAGSAWASPPAVGMMGKARSCLACHANSGPWTAAGALVLDMLERDTERSLKQDDGSFLIQAAPGEAVTVLAVLGYRNTADAPPPRRNGFLLIDTTTIATPALSKFAPGWEINASYGCRITGDQAPGYADATLTAVPLTLRPTASARDAELSYQVLLTRGEVQKGTPQTGMEQNYYERTVHLRVKD